MAPPLVHLQNIRLTLGGSAPLLDGAELSVAPGERVCLVGRNGSGKSTLLKIATGQVEADGGTVFRQPTASIRYLPQEPDFGSFRTVLAYVEAGLGPADDEYRARYMLEQLGMTGDEDPAHLSGGESRRAALARVMAPEPDVLLLDEPTNHLDLPAIEWLEKELASLRSAMVIISHDRRFLENLSRATVWLDRGRTRRIEEGFKSFEAWRDKVLAEEERDAHKLDRKIVAEEHWVRYGVTARRKRNMGRMAALTDLRQQRREARRVQGNVKLAASEANISGKLVVEAENVSKSFGQRMIIRDFSIRVLRGDRLAIAGPNGAGKTTLLHLITGKLEPDSGTVRLGAALEMATLDQSRAALKPEWTLQQALTGGHGDKVTINGAVKHVVGYMKDFLFTPQQALTPVNRLSGGERGRLALARALSTPSNLLILDEPTNDLDLETLDLLQEMLADYPGTLIVVSHDRDFLDRVATSILVSEGDARWQEYAGGYSDMIVQRGFGIGGEPVATEKPASRGMTRTDAASSARGERRKLSFKEKHALETLPARLAELQEKKAKIEEALATPGLYELDRARFDKLSEAAARIGRELDEAENQWLELEMLREEIEG